MRAANGPAPMGAGLRSAERSVANATEPSGPNSVLGLRRPARRGSTPDKQEVLTTNRLKRPTSQCSTFRCLLDSSRTLESRAHGQIYDLPNGSLERR
jgi:hypothetical protein